MEIIGKGAEAILKKKEDLVVKDRVSKIYRHPVIDKKLRRFRTRREAKVLEKLDKIGFPAPKLLEMNDDDMTINMSFISGKKLRDVLYKSPIEFCTEIGKKIGTLHNNDIIHADLTTSNMLLENDDIHFIDFGLSFFSPKVEDKACDLHLLDRAFESTHHDLYEQAISAALEGYKESNPEWEGVLSRLEQVQQRGRHKKK